MDTERNEEARRRFGAAEERTRLVDVLAGARLDCRAAREVIHDLLAYARRLESYQTGESCSNSPTMAKAVEMLDRLTPYLQEGRCESMFSAITNHDLSLRCELALAHLGPHRYRSAGGGEWTVTWSEQEP